MYISRGHRLKFPNEIAFLSLKIAFVGVDPDEMPHYAAFCTHLEATLVYKGLKVDAKQDFFDRKYGFRQNPQLLSKLI